MRVFHERGVRQVCPTNLGDLRHKEPEVGIEPTMNLLLCGPWKVVEAIGIEPTTSCVQGRCSPY